MITGAWDRSVKLWNINNSGNLWLPDGVHDYAAVTFSARSELVALGIGENNEARVWNLSASKEIAKLGNSLNKPMCAAFSPDKKLTGDLNGDIKIWDTNTGALKQILKGHTDAIYAIAFSPNGKRLISGGPRSYASSVEC